MLNTKIRRYLNADEFQDYCEREFRDSLAILDINLKNPNKLNQAASRALGWPCYEALKAMQDREHAIKEGIAIMRCESQLDRLTLKMKNVVVVFDGEFGELYIKAVGHGQEWMPLGRNNSLSLDMLGDNKKLPAVLSCDVDEDDSTRATLKTSFFTVLINRTHEGVILDVFDAEDTDFEECVDTAGVMFFEDAEIDGEEELVDLFSPAEDIRLKGLAGESYQWAKIVYNDDEEHELVPFNPGNEMDASEFVFETPEQAELALYDGTLGIQPEDIADEEGVLIRTLRTLHKTSVR